MADDLPDVATEVLRLEHQRLSIQVTMADQRAQLADFLAEEEGLRERIGEAESLSPPPLADDATDGDRFRRERDVASAARDVMALRIRISEIGDLRSRYDTNIEASEQALADLDHQIQAMKEANDG